MPLHCRTTRLAPARWGYFANFQSTIGAWTIGLHLGPWYVELYRTVPR